jgi:hypothetical protein
MHNLSGSADGALAVWGTGFVSNLLRTDDMLFATDTLAEAWLALISNLSDYIVMDPHLITPALQTIDRLIPYAWSVRPNVLEAVYIIAENAPADAFDATQYPAISQLISA